MDKRRSLFAQALVLLIAIFLHDFAYSQQNLAPTFTPGVDSQLNQRAPVTSSSWGNANRMDSSAGTTTLRSETQQDASGGVQPLELRQVADRGAVRSAAFQTPASIENEIHTRTPLEPPSEAMNSEIPSSGGGLGSLVSVGSSLLLVIGLFFGLAWLMRRTGAAGASSVSREVLEVIGRTSLGPRHQLVVLQFGSKLVLASLHQGDMRTLSEIDEPAEVARLLGSHGATNRADANEPIDLNLLDRAKGLAGNLWPISDSQSRAQQGAPTFEQGA